MSVRVYLAGKVGAAGIDRSWNRNWRNAIVKDERHLVLYPKDKRDSPPVFAGALAGGLSYTGPFLWSLDGFDWHSVPVACHREGGADRFFCNCGVSEGDYSHHDHCCDSYYSRERILEWSLRGIMNADIVFAWIDSPDCFGTLVELGYAHGLGKKCLVSFEKEDLADGIDVSEFWFANLLGDGEWTFGSPGGCFNELVVKKYGLSGEAIAKTPPIPPPTGSEYLQKIDPRFLAPTFVRGDIF